MKQRASEGMSAERCGLAIGEVVRAYGQPVTFTSDELASMSPKAKAFIEARLLVWFEQQSAEYKPEARVYAERKKSIRTVVLPAEEKLPEPSRFIGPRTAPAMFGTAKAVESKTKTEVINPKVEMTEQCPRMVVLLPERVWSK